MNFEWFIAKRYFRSDRKGSTFLSFIKLMTIGGVAIGAAGLLITLSIVHGFKSTIQEKILGFGNHITVMTYTMNPIQRADTLVTFLESLPDVEAAQAVIYGQGMVQSGSFVDGTFIKGVSVDGDLSDLRDYIYAGTYSLDTQPGGRPGIVMGHRLARSLNIEPGRTVTVYTVRGVPSPENFPEVMQFELTGVYRTGVDKFDDTLILMDIKHASVLFDLPAPYADQVDIQVTDLSRIDGLQLLLRDKIRFPMFSETIYQRYSNLFAWIELQEKIIPLIIAIMVIVAVFNLIGTILMMVLERTRDIGILKTMGAKNRAIRKVFLFEGLLVGLIGLGIGIGISILFYWIQGTYGLIPLSEDNYYMTTVPVEPHLLDFAIVSVVTLGLCALASFLPAGVASRVNPLNVIYFGR